MAVLKVIPELHLLDQASRQGSGDVLKDTLAPFAFFVLLRWVELQEQEEQAIALFDERTYEPLLPPTLSWPALSQLDKSELFQFLHEHLLPTLSDLHGSPLADILRTAAYAFDPKKIPESLQIEAFRLVADIPFDTADDLQEVDKVFRRLIKQIVETTPYAGEFITPVHVARLMLEIASPQPGQKIYDPCFGMGSLLVGAARRVTKAAYALEPSRWLDWQSSAIFGIEKGPVPFLVGMARVVLAGVNRPRLALADTLERDLRSPHEQYDLVLAAPPIGGKINDRWMVEQFPIRSKSTENIFLQHIMHALKPNGRAVVAIPEGILFRGGAEEYLRRQLLNEFCVEGVISLPAGTLQPYTGVKPNLLIFRRAEPSDSIWFQEVQPTGKSSNRAVLFDVKAEAARFRDRRAGEKAWSMPRAELTERNFDLTVKRRDVSELEALLKELRSRDASVKVVRLEEVADVVSGIGYTLRDTTREPTYESVPLVRVTELAKTGEIKQPSLFVSGLALERGRDRLLQSGDLLLSTQGTIGKVGRVREAFVGGMPAHGITVIRINDSSVQPTYVLRLLQSGPYQQWLAANASGTTIKNVPVRELRLLPIPLPRLAIQEAVAVSRTSGVDSSVLLKHFIAGTSLDEFSSFLLGSAAINEIIREEFDETRVIERFSRLAAELRPWRNKVAHDYQLSIRDEGLAKWLMAASELSSEISDAFELPMGSERLAMLEGMRDKISRLEARLISDPSVEDRLEAITSVFRKTIERGCQSVLDKVVVSATLNPAIIDADVPAEMMIRLRNEGSLPLRNFRVILNSKLNGNEIKFLHVGRDVSVNLNVQAQPTGTHTLKVKWDALRLDGTRVGDEVTLGYRARNVTASSVSPSSGDLGPSPYIIGPAVDSQKRPEMFYGREEIIGRVVRALNNKEAATVILIEGVRRSGKSSILKRLLLPEMLPDWLSVYCDFQGGEGSRAATGLEAKNIFSLIAESLVTAVYRAGIPLEVVGAGHIDASTSRTEFGMKVLDKLRQAFDTEHPFRRLDLQVEAVLEAVKPKRMLLILDEFDKIQEGIDNRVTSPQVPENIRALFQKYTSLSGIITGARRIKSLRQNYWSALFGIGTTINVSALEIEAAMALVTRPVEDRLVYTPEARDRVVSLCACQPYFIQVLCERIFDESARTGLRNITPSVVEAAANKVIDDNEHFQTLWDYLGTARRRYLTILVKQLSEGPDRVTEEAILERMEAEGFVRENLADVNDDLNGLQEIEVLALHRQEMGDGLGTSYYLRVPLFSRWISKHIDETVYRRLAMDEM